MEEKLQPCPYCGNNKLEMKTYRGLYGIECLSCYRPSWSYYKTKRAAINAWNKKQKSNERPILLKTEA